MTHVIEKYKVTLEPEGLSASKCSIWFSHSLCFVNDFFFLFRGDCLVYKFLPNMRTRICSPESIKNPLVCVDDGLMYTCNPNAGKAEAESLVALWTGNHMACSY